MLSVWQYGRVAIRLSVATLGVATLAYLTSPLGTLIGFIIFIGGPVGWSAYISRSSERYGKLPVD